MENQKELHKINSINIPYPNLIEFFSLKILILMVQIYVHIYDSLKC